MARTSRKTGKGVRDTSSDKEEVLRGVKEPSAKALVIYALKLLFALVLLAGMYLASFTHFATALKTVELMGGSSLTAFTLLSLLLFALVLPLVVADYLFELIFGEKDD